MDKKGGVEKYFEGTRTPCTDGTDERRSLGRRVSFAPATEIRYVVPREDGSKSESSSLENMCLGPAHTRLSAEPAHMHAEHSFFSPRSDCALCEEEGEKDREKNFIMDDSDESTYDGARMSICAAKGDTMDLTRVAHAGDRSTEMFSEMLSEIVGAEEAHTIYDTVNVEDLARPHAKKLRDVVAEAGIRFLDNLSLGPRRETLSKMRNKVAPEKRQFFSEFLRRRVDFCCAFAAELVQEIEAKRRLLGALESSVYEGEAAGDAAAFSLQLRQLKADARRRSKAQWHSVRAEKERAFADAAGQARSRMGAELLLLKQERAAVEHEISSVDVPAPAEEQRAPGAPEEPLAEAAAPAHPDEQDAVLASLEAEQRALSLRLADLAAEAAKTELAAREEAEAIAALEKREAREEVSEEDLRKAREETRAAEDIFGVEVRKVAPELLVVALCGAEVQISFRKSGLRTEIFALSAQGASSPFAEFASRGARSRVLGMSVEKGLRELLRYTLLFHEKEVRLLGVRYPYEVRVGEEDMRVVFEVKQGRRGEMGHVAAVFALGDSAPRFETNIRGVSPRAKYGALSEALAQASGAAGRAEQ